MATPDTATYSFKTSPAAWAFMRVCDSAGVSAGFPSLDGRNTVKVSIRTWQEREQVDALAGTLPTAYAFGA